jgi:hypothetical protein
MIIKIHRSLQVNKLYVTLKNVIMIGTIIATLLTSGAAFAGGPRGDSPEDSTREGVNCWVDGFDAGFAGKYDQERANECQNQEGDEYNSVWGHGCDYTTYTEDKCAGFKNNPVNIEDHESLSQENAQNCWNDGYEDGKADNPFNKDRASGCDEYTPDYEGGYNSGCIIDTTEASCELLIKGEKNYCPWHPDIAACVEFLHNATNKTPEPISLGACGVMGDPRPNIICPQESNPEGYCLRVNHTAFCKTIGDLCDPDGFVKPEYPYCTTN